MRFIRNARPEDAGVLCQAERAVVARFDGLLVSEPDELVEAEFAQRIGALARGSGAFLVAVVDGNPVAHASLAAMNLRNVSHVLRLSMCVHIGHWRQGHGEAILRELLTRAQREPDALKIELLVRSENTPAIALYRKLGFVEEGRMKDRVRLRSGRCIDDISMALPLQRHDS